MSPYDTADHAEERRFATLGVACEIRGGWTTAASPSGTLPMVRTSDISQGRVEWATVPFCKTDPPDPTRFLLQDGDILVARTGVGSAGNIAFVRDPPPSVFASYVLRLRPHAAFDGLYIAFYLQSPSGRDALAHRAQGASLINLSAARLATLMVPSPSRANQTTVAGHLAEAKDLVDHATAALDRVMERLPALRAETLSTALSATGFEDLRSWTSSPLGDISTNFDRKRIPLNSVARAARSGDYPYYGASAIIDHVDGWTHEGTFLLVSEDGNNLVSRKTPIAFIARGPFWLTITSTY